MSCLKPKVIVSREEEAQSNLNKLLMRLLNCSRLNAQECDQVKLQYIDFQNEAVTYHKEEFKSYSTQDKRLDEFYYSFLGQKEKYSLLWKMVKSMLILFHGQSDVERGFSVNSDIISCNMGEDTLVAYRLVYQGLKNLGENADEIVITQGMRESCRSTRHRYVEYQEEKKKKEKLMAANDEKATLKHEIKKREKEEADHTTEAAKLTERADHLCHDAAKKKSWDMLSESNAIRETVERKRKLLQESQKKTEQLRKKLKKL